MTETLDVETPASRRTDPVSSVQAEAATTTSGRRKSQQRAAAAAVEAWPGMTSSELARHSGIDRYILARRLPEIEGRAVLRLGMDRDTKTGRLGVLWWPLSTAIEMLADVVACSAHPGPELARIRDVYGPSIAERVQEAL